MRLGVSVRTVSRWEQGTAEPGSVAQKATIASHAGDSLPKELSSWSGLGTALFGPAGILLGAAAVGVAATKAAEWLTNRGQDDPRDQAVLSGFKTQAATLGVSWKPYRDGLIKVLTVARDGDMGLDDVIHLLSIKE